MSDLFPDRQPLLARLRNGLRSCYQFVVFGELEGRDSAGVLVRIMVGLAFVAVASPTAVAVRYPLPFFLVPSDTGVWPLHWAIWVWILAGAGLAIGGVVAVVIGLSLKHKALALLALSVGLTPLPVSMVLFQVAQAAAGFYVVQ